MSSVTSKVAASPAKADAKSSPLQAVSLLESPLAKAIALGRPAMLLGALSGGMRFLVKDPARTLWISLPMLAGIQVAYAVTALPPTSSSAAKKLRPGEKKRKTADGTGPVFASLLALIMSAMTIPVVYILFVLFGAPFLNNTTSTVLCAAHFILLGVFPVCYTRGMDREAFVAVAGLSAPLDEAFGALVGAALGAWLGAIPIPLDWDRDWQRWPVTIVVGMYAGACIGSLVAGSLLHGKQLVSTTVEDEKEE